MDFRYLPVAGAPPPPIYPSTQQFSYAPLPPPAYDGKYHLPPPSDHGYFYSRPSRAGMLPRGKEYERERTQEEVLREEVLREVLRRGHYSFLPYRPPKDPFLEREYERERTREELLREEVLREVLRRGHYSFLPYRPPKDPFLEREYERERIREEVLREVLCRGHYSFLSYRPPKDPFLEREYERERIREEVLREEVRRSIIEEEVRWELAMERYYNLRHSNPGYHGTWTNVQFEQPRFSHGCQTRGPRGQVASKHSSPKCIVRGAQHKIMEMDKEEMPKTLVSGDQVKPNKEEIKKKKDEQTVHTEADENKSEINVSEKPHKITEVYYEEIRQPQALLKDKVQSPKDQEELRPKASLPEETMTKDKIMPTSNTEGIEKKGDGRVLNTDSGNKLEQPASSKAPLPEKAWPKDKTNLFPNRSGLEGNRNVNKALKPDSENKVKQPASKALLPKYKMKAISNRNGIEKEKFLKPETGKKVGQLTFSESSKTRVLLQIPTLAALGFLPPYPPLSRPAYQNDQQTHVLLKMPTAALGSHLPYSLLSGVAHQKGQQEPLNVAGSCGSKRKGSSISALANPASSSSNKVGPKNVKQQKVDRNEHSCTSCQITAYSDRTWLEHVNGKKHQNKLKNVANVETSKKELLKVAETRGSKRKNDSMSALPTPAATRNSSYGAYRRIVKKQKVHKKEYSCTFCQLTVNSGQEWLFHLNGKKHRRNTLEKLTNVDMTKKVSSDSDNKSTPGIALSAVKVEMDNGDSLATKPTEKLQMDKGIVKNKVELLPLFKKTRRGKRGVRRNINSKI